MNQMTVLLQHRTVPRQIKQLAISLVKFPPRKVEDLLTAHGRDCFGHAAGADEHPEMTYLLESYSNLWTQERGQAALMSAFAPKSYYVRECLKRVMRPFLPPVEKLELRNPILEWDFKQAIYRDDVEVSRLESCPALVPVTFLTSLL